MRRNRIKIEPAKVQPTRTIEDEVACSSPKVKRKKKNKIRKQDSDVEVENEIPAQIFKFETEEILRDTTPCRESGETSSQRNDDVPKKKKKKKKIKEGVLADNISPLEEEDKVEKINGVLETNDDSNFPKSEPESSSRLWPKEKLDRLISQMEAVLPKNDSLKYTSRLGKLDWKAISFDEYSPEECQEMWRHIQAKIRCYRILKEILEDARQCINDDNFLILNGDRPKKPAKPLTSFMLYYHDTKNDVLKKHPGLNVTEISKRVSEMWKSLSPKKLEKYKNRAADLRQKYKEQLKIFYREHPEEMAGKKGKCKPDDLGFSKPKSAFQLFHQAMREKHPSSGAGELIEKCKRKWKSMSEKKKVVWIEAAQQEEASYKENLKKYESEHPGYVAPPMKTLITKRDKHILNNLSGKPKKPATNAYSLYSQESLQNGSLKEIPSKDRLAEISRRWKALAQEERDAYVARCEELQKEYKIEYQKFLDNLPPERRLEELEKMQPKRRKTDSKGSQAKKLKISEEPVQPPVNEFELFKQKHENEWNENSLIPVSDSQARAKWKKISQSEKQKYSAELQKLRSNYIGELTEYLKHCPPNKLAHYVALIALQQQQQYGGPEQITVSSEDTEPDSDSE